MLHSKEDQLLAKLQKCVGKLNNQTSIRSQQRQPDRFLYGQLSHRKTIKQPQQKYDYYNQQKSVNLGIRQPTRTTRLVQDKQNCYEPPRQTLTARNSISKEYFSQRNYQYSNSTAKQFQNYAPKRAYEAQQIKRNYETKKDIQYTQYPAKASNYNQDCERLRRPLRQYQVNVQNNNISKPKTEKKQYKMYINEKQEENVKQKIEATPLKYQGYKISDDYQKQYSSNRNSISFAQGLNRPSFKQQSIGKNINERYERKQVQKIKSSLKTNLTQLNKGNKSQRIDLLHSNSVVNRSRQISCQQKMRNGGIGSISSISRKIEVEQNKRSSYETFQQRQIKQLNLKQILEDVGNNGQDTFSKLQRISQLNQRINKRIKNIIETFESK